MTKLWTSLLNPIQRHFREQRASLIVAQFPEIRGKKILDIGGSFPFWKISGPIIAPSEVKILNINSDRTTMSHVYGLPGVSLELYDGQKIPEPDDSYEFVISNSVIEHVPVDERANFAREIARVGRRYVVQTPAIHFPVDQHFGLPFMHWLPRRIARFFLPITPFNLLVNASARSFFDETKLLRKRELQRYFPDGEILTERYLGIPKSFVVFGPAKPA